MFQQSKRVQSSQSKYGPYMRTWTGKYFYPDQVDQLQVDILDIAHALSNMCRYNGHLNHFYSVAQHSLIVSELVPQEYALEGLLHDACEAYIPDMPSPLKRVLPEFVEFQEEIMKHVFKHFNLRYPLPGEVDYIDKTIRSAEIFWLSNWDEHFLHVFDYKIVPVEPKVVEQQFLTKFEELTHGTK